MSSRPDLKIHDNFNEYESDIVNSNLNSKHSRSDKEGDNYATDFSKNSDAKYEDRKESEGTTLPENEQRKNDPTQIPSSPITKV